MKRTILITGVTALAATGLAPGVAWAAIPSDEPVAPTPSNERWIR